MEIISIVVTELNGIGVVYYGESFGVCDFCDSDSSGSGIKWVKPIGQKGICNKCANDLAKTLNNLVSE